jgi:hypothetical protein
MRRLEVVVLQPVSYTLVEREGRFVAVIPDAPDACHACRWCYGQPMPGFDVCSRVRCITNVQAVDSLDTITWRGEDR